MHLNSLMVENNKSMRVIKLNVIVTMFFLAACSPKNAIKIVNTSKPDPFIEQLIAKMTLDEKLGQMTLYTTDWETTGPTIRGGYKDDIKSGRCGALFNSHTVDFTTQLQKIAIEETRLKIPLLFGYDVIHGYKTMFPIPLGEAASWDLQAIEKSAYIMSKEAAASGLHWTFAPMVDISREPRWGRVMEGAGEDPYLGSRIAEARVKGIQGDGFAKTDRLLACVKHFAAYGAPIAGRDYNSVEISERVFRETYLPPYEAAIKAGAKTVMTSFNDYNGRRNLGGVQKGAWVFTSHGRRSRSGRLRAVRQGIHSAHVPGLARRTRQFCRNGARRRGSGRT